MDSSTWLSKKRAQFEVVFPLLMLEPFEKAMIYVFLVVILLMLLYTSVMYLPSHLYHIAHHIIGIF